ncbi:MAG: sensor histidine kinase [Candidatus Limivicinus sp.]|jgi:two-component system sensor histidine kinase AgrC
MIERICYAFVYLFEAFIAISYYEYIFERRTSIYTLLATAVIVYAVCYGTFFFDSMVINSVSMLGANFILLLVNYHCNLKTAILQTAFLSFIMTITEVVVIMFLGFFDSSFDVFGLSTRALLSICILSKLLYLIVAMFSARLFKPHKDVYEEPKMMALFCSLPLFSMFISVFVCYLGLNAELNSSAEIMVVITFMALITVNLLFFAIYNYIQKENKAFMDMQISIQKDEANAAYYKALAEQSENQKILIHDIKKHLNTINNLTTNEEVKAYIADISKLTEINHQNKFCENPILNLILQQYSQKCLNAGINFNCDIRADVLSFMDSASITALFENLLSNAYETALKAWEKKIDISAFHGPDGRSTVITVENSCDVKPQTDGNGNLKTSKDSRGLHGYGLKSVDRVVRKYAGISSHRYDEDEKVFHFTIRFPCPASKCDKDHTEIVKSNKKTKL